MTRAVLEGVCLRPARRPRADGRCRHSPADPDAGSGGGLVSPLWRQILADVLEAEIAQPTTTEGAAYGAALCAAVGAGWFSTVEEATTAVVTAEPMAAPGTSAVAYAEQYAAYRELYPALAPWFHRGQARPPASEV